MPHRSDGDAAGSASAPTQTILGRYRIEKTLGQGGMGEVLLALDTLLGRRVALKRLLPDGVDLAQQRAAILKEARRASLINDRHIAAIYDVLDLDQQVVLVMEYVDGVTLRERMNQPVGLDAFWDLASQCVEGMAVAHARGVIHRDLKPENLMVTREGLVKILDFGIARRSGPPGTTTTTTGHAGDIVGTPQYMAPEAHLGVAVDERADIFALGAVFYELLTARRPFEGGSYAAVLAQVLNVDPPPVSERNPEVGAGLSAVIARMLAKDAAARVASTDELAKELAEARRADAAPESTVGESISTARDARPAPTPDRRVTQPQGESLAVSRSPATRARAAWLVPALSVIGLAALLGVAWRWRSLATALPRDRNVAIVAAGAGGGDDFAFFGIGALELLSTRLRRHSMEPGFQMASFAEGLKEKVRTPEEARRVLGTNLAMIATIERRADVDRARLELIDTVRGKRIAARTVEVPAAQPFLFMDRTYRAAAAMLGLRPRSQDAASESGVRGAGTLRFHLQGIGRMRSGGTLEETRKAITDFENACRMEPRAAVTRAALASAQIRVHTLTDDAARLARAEATAREAVALGPDRPEPHAVLAAALAIARRQDEALREYAHVVQLDPTDDDASLKLGRTYNRLGQPEREKESYLSTIARRPHCWKPYWWLATWYFRHGDVDESMRAYREVIRRSHENFEGYSSLGAVLVLQGDYGAAIDTLRHSIDLRPTKNAYDNLGTAYFNSGRYEAAIEAYNQSFQFGEAGYESWLNLGDAYSWLQGRQQDAAGAYAQAIRLGREQAVDNSRRGGSFDVMIPANLATVFARIGERDSARVYLASAVSADSANPRVAYCAALTCWQLGEKPRAIEWLKKSVQGGYPTAWLRDSPVFREWRAIPEFRALVGEASPRPQPAAARS